MQRAALLAAIPPALARVRDDIARLARDAVTLSAAHPVGLPEVGASRLGGTPDLPAGVGWPLNAGQPLACLLQLRLRDLAGLPAAADLPFDGTLWWFTDPGLRTYGDDPAQRDAWRVLYVPGDGPALAATSFPAALAPAACFAPAALTCAATATLPERPTLELPDLTWTPAEQRAYEDWYGDLITAHAPRHQLLGDPLTLQDDMRPQCQQMTAGAPDPADPQARRWRLLAQIDSEPAAGLILPDGGLLYLWLTADDLRARDFSRVWQIMQTT